MRRLRVWCLAFVFAWLGACSVVYENPVLEAQQPESGYRFRTLAANGNSDELFVVLTLSGGGTRAAALSHGVMETLRQVSLPWQGRHTSLLDEVDVISSVSGGSFTAAYYGLFRDRLFRDFPQRMLYRDLQAELVNTVFWPPHALRFIYPEYRRTELAVDLYDDTLFEGRTFADLQAAGRPYIILNATDVSLGVPFRFIQSRFDTLCSDLSRITIGRAVAASSAFPGAFSPLTLRNHPDGCGYRRPGWFALAPRNREYDPAGYQRYLNEQSYLAQVRDPETGGWRKRRPYIHLTDGGVADNLGLRAVIDSLVDDASEWSINKWINRTAPRADGNARSSREDRKGSRHLVIIVVDAGRERAFGLDRVPTAPGLTDVLTASASVPIDNYSRANIELVREQLAQRLRNESRLRRGRQPLPGDERAPGLHFVYLGFNNVRDDGLRHRLNDLPTNFHLPREDVDLLRRTGCELLRDSVRFAALLKTLGAKFEADCRFIPGGGKG